MERELWRVSRDNGREFGVSQQNILEVLLEWINVTSCERRDHFQTIVFYTYCTCIYEAPVFRSLNLRHLKVTCISKSYPLRIHIVQHRSNCFLKSIHIIESLCENLFPLCIAFVADEWYRT